MPDPLSVLLEVQGLDLAADTLRHRRETLPERALLAAEQAAIAGLDSQLKALDARLHELGVAQRRLEDEVAALAAKADAENTRLYSGSVKAIRELQAIQEEIDGLGRRRSALEDDVLVLMEEIEPLAAQSTALAEERVAREREAARLIGVIGEGEAAIDAELATTLAARAALVDAVPADLVATYEKVRAQLGGVAIARLEGTQCGGCHLTLPAMELDAVRHVAEGSLVTHEECGRILVPR
ncbi:MAG: hypothetical protein JF603_05805 [Acidobacteria bacterium]|nr:hypothetical protein [Acidobacteriota bacterium]